MRPSLPEETRQEVIRLLLLGLGRNEIAPRTKISTGSVSNIIDKWREDIGKPEAESFMDLAKSIRASDLSPAQCAVGLRISNKLKKIGLDLDSNFEQFLSDTYEKCVSRNITPEKIASHMHELGKISDDLTISEIDELGDKKIAELKALEEQKQGLINDVSAKAQQKLEAEKDLERVLERKRKIGDELKDYDDAKQQLEQCGLTLTDSRKSAETIKGMKEYGYDSKRIIADIEVVRYFNRERNALTTELNDKRMKVEEAKRQCNQLQSRINLHSQKLSVLESFESYGVSGKVLMELFDKIMDISLSNNVPFYVAFNKFSEDMPKQYDQKLGLESAIESLKSKTAKLTEERQQEEKKLNNQRSGISLVLGNRVIEL